MVHMAKKFCAVLALMSVGLSAQAGHLFSQALLNTPVQLNAGFGVDIPQITMEGASSQANIYLCDFDSGDVLRFILPGFTLDLDADSLPAGWTNSGTACPSTGTLSGSPSPPAMEALNLALPFDWRVEAVAGSFTLEGFRLGITNGTVNGTGAGLVNQSGVTPTGGSTAVPVFSPLHMVLLILGLIGVVGIRQRMARQH